MKSVSGNQVIFELQMQTEQKDIFRPVLLSVSRMSNSETLWGLFVALKFHRFLKKIIQNEIEPKLSNSETFANEKRKV